MIWTRCWRCALGLALGIGAAVAAWAATAESLTLHATRQSAFDLEVTGSLVGTSERAFLRHADLATLPQATLDVKGGFEAPDTRHELTVVWLSDLWASLPRASGADTILARCKDGYFSVYRAENLAALKPFLVLEINGHGPADWPVEGMRYNPGPNVILVSGEVAPAVDALLDPGHKKPWGVTSLEIGAYADLFKPAYSGKWNALSPEALLGRDIWINSCASCHVGPGGMVGGIKSGRPFEVVAAHAGYNRAYFEHYVRDPKGAMPGATMEAHPHYNDQQMAALIAFITADGKK